MRSPRHRLDTLPDALYPRATSNPWKLPQVNGAGISVALDRLHDVAADEQETRVPSTPPTPSSQACAQHLR